MIGAALSGTAWAAGVAAFGPGAPLDVGLFLFVIVAGLLAGSAGTLSEHLPAFLAFAVPVAASASAVALLSGHALERVLAPFVVLYLGSITRTARAGDRRLRATLELGFRNEELVADLSAAQAHLTVLNAGLERRVAERSEQLARVERQLGQAALLASVGGLAASVAHEINNPIASVLANLGYLQDELAADRPDLGPCRDALSDARRGADRVRETVRSLSAVARADHGGEAVDLQAVLEACTSVVAGEVRRRAVLSRDYGQVPPVRGDTPGLAQVFIQLLLQTAWAIPEGAPAGRSLMVRTAWDEARGRVVVEIAGPAGADPVGGRRGQRRRGAQAGRRGGGAAGRRARGPGWSRGPGRASAWRWCRRGRPPPAGGALLRGPARRRDPTGSRPATGRRPSSSRRGSARRSPAARATSPMRPRCSLSSRVRYSRSNRSTSRCRASRSGSVGSTSAAASPWAAPTHGEDAAPAHEHGALAEVPQLADVARPAVALQRRQHLGRRRRGGPAVALGEGLAGSAAGAAAGPRAARGAAAAGWG